MSLLLKHIEENNTSVSVCYEATSSNVLSLLYIMIKYYIFTHTHTLYAAGQVIESVISQFGGYRRVSEETLRAPYRLTTESSV